MNFAPLVTSIIPPNKTFTIITNPNPFDQKLNIQIKGKRIEDGQLRLFDLASRPILQQQFIGNQLNLKRGDLPGGMYFYQIQDGHRNIGQGKIIAR